MKTEGLELELHAALTHLHDPQYVPSAQLAALLDCPPAGGALAVQAAIVEAIGEMQPSPDAAPGTPARRIYDLLHDRFVLKLTLQETADRMNLSFSSTCRTQRTAIHALARRLWERQVRTGRLPEPASGPAAPGGDDWRAQGQRELAALTARGSGEPTSVDRSLHSACDLLAPVLARLQATVELAYVQPGLVTTVHPSALRQLLVTALRRVAQCAAPGTLAVYAILEDGCARVTISAIAANAVAGSELTTDLLAPDDVVIEATTEGSQLTLALELPSVGTVTVLLVDDNQDMARLFYRAAESTRYRIVHIAQGADLFETIRAVAPDVIVLDVMLPDVDGWDLLMQLRADPATDAIPVLICSVVKEEELALALGASAYLAKPARPREFIAALDRLLPPD